MIDVDFINRHYLDADGRMKLLPASSWQALPPDILRAWCYSHGVYGIPTKELVAWLRAGIGDRSVIEIGAGVGDLGYHLGIPQTDSFTQASGKWDAFFALIGQKPTLPRADVVRLEAAEAVAHYKPQVVIGSWVTRKYVPGVDDKLSSAFAEGVSEEALFDAVDAYIVIGNERVHGDKTLLSRHYECQRAPWLISRASVPEDNCIYIWERDPFDAARWLH